MPSPHIACETYPDVTSGGNLLLGNLFAGNNGHFYLDYILISTSTPAGKFKLVNASIVFAFGSRISTIRL